MTLAEHHSRSVDEKIETLSATVAASAASNKSALSVGNTPNIGIVAAFNDMLSAHQSWTFYPERIKQATRVAGAAA